MRAGASIATLDGGDFKVKDFRASAALCREVFRELAKLPRSPRRKVDSIHMPLPRSCALAYCTTSPPIIVALSGWTSMSDSFEASLEILREKIRTELRQRRMIDDMLGRCVLHGPAHKADSVHWH